MILKDFRVGFADYSEAIETYADNSMQSKTQSVVAFGSTGSISGSLIFLSILSDRIITRYQFNILLILDNIIDHMNKLFEICRSMVIWMNYWFQQPMSIQIMNLNFMIIISSILKIRLYTYSNRRNTSYWDYYSWRASRYFHLRRVKGWRADGS